MGLKNLHLKLKALGLKHFKKKDGGNEKREAEKTNRKPLWMTPVSHGYHVVKEQQSLRGSEKQESDSVLVQREQIGELVLWLFGVFDEKVRDGIPKYIQSHLFDNTLNESEIRKRSKEVMRKAFLGARAKVKETQNGGEASGISSASVMVINGEKLVMANMGDYRVVLSRNGVSQQISTSNFEISSRKSWTHKFFPGIGEGTKKNSSSELVVVATDNVDSDIEFIVIANSGLWKVMNNDEAVGLIRHMEDPQEAAEFLTKESSARMGKSGISCIVIRFD